MFLTGTLLNVAAVLTGTTIGLLAGARVPPRMQESLTTALGFFTLVLGLSMALPIFTSPDALPGDDLAILAARQPIVAKQSQEMIDATEI